MSHGKFSFKSAFKKFLALESDFNKIGPSLLCERTFQIKNADWLRAICLFVICHCLIKKLAQNLVYKTFESFLFKTTFERKLSSVT